MKKSIGLFVVIVFLVTTFFAFSSPVCAYDDYIYVNEPYYETMFYANGDIPMAEIAISVSRSGYYMIQTFGFPAEENDELYPGFQIENTAMSLVDSFGDYVGYAESSTGYDYGCFMFVELSEELDYILEITCSHACTSRLSITYAEGLFELPNRTDLYSQILTYGISTEFSTTVEFRFYAFNKYQAQVSLVISDGDTFRTPLVYGCGYEKVYLIDPRMYINSISAYGRPAIYEITSPDFDGVDLEAGVPYYLVTYLDFGSGDGDYLFHDVPEIIVQIVF